MKCPTCASEVHPGPTCSACGAALPREADPETAVLATTPAAAGLRYQVVVPGDVWLQTRNLRSLAGALFPLFPSQGSRGSWTKVLGD
jgi:hypothetical protein